MKKFITTPIAVVLVSISLSCTLQQGEQIGPQREVIALSDENNVLRSNLALAYENIGQTLYNVEVEDTLKDVYTLQNLFVDNDKLLICRMSEKFCGNCEEDAVNKILRYVDASLFDKVVFVGTFKNVRLLNRIIDPRHIRDFKVVNTSYLSLNADEKMMPYYMVVNNELKVESIYFPSKATESLDSTFIRELCKKLY